MTRQVLYVAHPLAPSEAEIEYAKAAMGRLESWGVAQIAFATQQNVQRAIRWLAWLRKSFPETTFIAPWIAAVMSDEDDVDPAAREVGLVDDCAVVERCDGIVLCGGRISSGMRREMEHGQKHGRWTIDHDGPIFEVYDLSIGSRTPNPSDGEWLGPDPTRCPQPWSEWAECFRK